MSEFRLIIKDDKEETEVAEVLVDGTIAGNDYRFLLDTGAAKSSIKNDTTIGKFKMLGEQDSNGVFSKEKEQLIVVPNIALGPISKKNFVLSRRSKK